MKRRIAVLRPSLAGGLYDYAALLAAGLEGSVPAGYPDWRDRTPVAVKGEIGLLEAPAPRREAFDARLQAVDTLIFNYVGYGYARRGAPWRLVSTICDWKARHPKRSLLTFVHEIHNFGPPWSSSFWLSPVQKHLLRRLVKTSDVCVTSNESFATVLRRWVSAERIVILPVCSNIGEAEMITGWGEREPAMVVFGTPPVREGAYYRVREQLSRAVEELEVREILDIGASTAVPDAIAGIPVRTLGLLPQPEVSRLLRTSRFGFLSYPPHLLDKSGVFAAYTAHGVCPIVGCRVEKIERAEGEGVHWLPAWSETKRKAEPQTIGAAARLYYETHSLERHVRLHEELIAGAS